MESSSARFQAEEALGLLPLAIGAEEPFPWQKRLLERLIEGKPPRALDLPTGLGKTSVMAIWLLARAAGAELPRRLVYVVDRRAVVDQATEEAERLRDVVSSNAALRNALGLPEGRALPVSTLRGQLIGNRDWLNDPASPAIIVGTVDMIGSRLLFSGYGVSRKMRPYHAGLLGVDTLFVLDESHLVPSFERLLEATADAAARGLGASPEVAVSIPRCRLISLSATGKTSEDAFRLTDEDRQHPIVRKRLYAAKALSLRPAVNKKDFVARVMEEAWGLANGETPRRVVVFLKSRQDAEGLEKALQEKRRREKREISIELFVGARRAFEREKAAEWLREHQFMGFEGEPSRSAILIATSAAEVGVDLDADAAVMDLVPWQRMVQRLGRVNRRGFCSSSPVVIIPLEEEEKKGRKKGRAESEEERRLERLKACAELIRALPPDEGGFEGGPAALESLRKRIPDLEGLIERASEPDPLHPPLLRPHLDAWAMTSLAEHPGRPEVHPWLRGWVEDTAPETTVVFREELPVVRTRGRWVPFDERTMESFMEAAGPHPLERLEVDAELVYRWLARRLVAFSNRTQKPDDDLRNEPVAVLVRRDGKGQIIEPDEELPKNRLVSRLAGAVLLVSPRLGGLEKGLLDEKAPAPGRSDPSWDLTKQNLPQISFRIQKRQPADERKSEDDFLFEKEFVAAYDEEGQPASFLRIERRKSEPPITEAGRSVARRSQSLEEHQSWVADEAERVARGLDLDERLEQALRVAALLHDEGKRAERWQRAFRVDDDLRPLAKSESAPLRSILGGYRHELGSLPRMQNHPAFMELDPEMKELALHLVAAHHGRARPTLPIDDAEGPPTLLRKRAQEVALRFDRLSRIYGPWGLAWLEALLRAADQRASARLNEVNDG